MNSELTTMAYSEAMSQSRPTFFQIRKNSGMVFVTKDGDTCYLTDSHYLEATERELIEKGFTLADNTLGSTEGLNGLIRRHGVKRLAIEDLHMIIGEYEDLRRTLPVELIHAGMAIDKLRAYLTPEDRDALGHAQSLAEKALAETLEVFRIGMTEKELEAELVYRMYLNGADDLSFKPEIISGANASMPHGNPSDKPIAAGDALIMDFGLVKNGFWSDMSRTLSRPAGWRAFISPESWGAASRISSGWVKTTKR